MSGTAWAVLGAVALLAMMRKPTMTTQAGAQPFVASNPDPIGTAGTGNTNALTSLIGAVRTLLQPKMTGPGNTPMITAPQTPASLPGTISGAAGGTPTLPPSFGFQIDPWFYNPMYDSPDGYFDIQSGTMIPHNY